MLHVTAHKKGHRIQQKQAGFSQPCAPRRRGKNKTTEYYCPTDSQEFHGGRETYCMSGEYVAYLKGHLFKEFIMAKTAIDSLGWGINLILTIFLDWPVQGVNRILRGKVIFGILWLITAGLFGIGWIIDIITMLLYKKITFLA